MDLVDRFIHKYGRLPTEFDKDYLEMLRMSKYKVVPFPHYKPSKCSNCGSSKVDDRQYVDFGLEIEWYGIVYFCTICLEDIARNVGLFEQYKEMLISATAEINALKEKLVQGVSLPDNLVKAWEEFKEYYVSVQPAEPSSSPPVISSSSDNTVVQESNETESDKLGTNAAKPRASKSTSGSGSKNVRSLADLLDTPRDS